MSEETNSSESASGTAKSESASRPPGTGRNVWLMIVAILVVVVLVVAALYMIPPPEKVSELTVEIQGPLELEVNAGVSQNFTVVVMLGDEDVTNDTRTTLFWTLSPNSIGSLVLKSRPEVPFRAAIQEGTGAVNCTATFQESDTSDALQASDQKVLKVLPPFLDAVSISPSSKTIQPGANWTFTVTAVSSVGLPISDVDFEWSIAAETGVTATLSADSGVSVVIQAGSVLGNVTLTASGTYSGVTKSGTSAIVIGYPPPRSMDYVWYDMFEVPIGPWYDTRWPNYHEEEVVSYSNPSLFFYHSGEGKYLYTLMRLNVTGRNVSEINTNVRPEFLPTLSQTERGGTANIDWYLQYLSNDEVKNQYPSFYTQDDGWIVKLTGTTTMDKQAAKMVLNLTETGFETFDSWWAGNEATVIEKYNNFLVEEATGPRLDIQNAYDYYLQLFTNPLKAEKVGDKIVMHYDLVTWGMEALLMRWLHETFLPVEMWYEDMHFRMTIGPEWSDIDIDTAVTYSLYATETIDSMGDPDVMPCWVFQPLLGDAYESTPAHPHSDIDRYLPYSYLNRQPDSSLYGEYMQYDVTPTAWNLTDNETLTVKWPAGDENVLFRWRISEGNVINVTDNMVVSYSEPLATDFPDQVLVNNTAGEISFIGPINMYDWSKTQSTHQYLADEWLRLGGELLPYWLPWIEFRMNEKPIQYLDHFDLSINNTAFPANDDVTVTVTAVNNWNTTYRAYTGTVNFTSSDAAALLPDNYTFLSGDNGVHTFTAAAKFQTLGAQTMTVLNVSTDLPLRTGVANFNVLAKRNASSMQVDVYHVPAVGVLEDVTVTVFDQYDDLFVNYTGTATFSSNRSVDVTLPTDYVFQLSDAGVHAIAGGLNFAAIGWFTINASDIDNPLADGTQTNIGVVASPEVIDHFNVTGIKNMLTRQKSDVSVTAYNQYGQVFERYTGTIHFEANSSGAVLPADYTFAVADKGHKVFTKGVSFSLDTSWVFTVTVTDTVVTTATGSQSNIMIDYRPADETFTMYDFYKEPWGEWWPWRYPGYKTDIILNNESGKYTMLYNADMKGLQGIIYAPYRWNITGTNLSQVSVHEPEFMPVLGTPNVPGAEASLDVYFQYLDRTWWNNYWKPVWHFSDAIINAQMSDGWNPGLVYGVTMNRAAAEEWLGMPQTGVNPLTWWAMNGGNYMADWREWIVNEGNNRVDIWAGYEWPYVDVATNMKLQVLPDGKIYLQIGSIAWGYEILITRWFNETNLCNHEAYFEDMSMHVDFYSNWIDMNFDAVCQYSLRAVKANESATNEPAWAWQPLLIDYVASWNTPGGLHPSKFDPWDPSFSLYQSWNAGDPSYMGYVPYDSGYAHFNLSEYQTFIIKIPQGNDNLGYLAEPMPFDSIRRILKGYTGTTPPVPNIYDPYPRGDGQHYNYTAYWPLMVNGTMSLGWWGNWTGDPNLDTMYDPVTNILTMEGPMSFDNTYQWNGALYFGAPWIEFNITPVYPILSIPGPATNVPTGGTVTESAPTLATTEMISAITIVSAAMLIIASIAVISRRKDE